MGRDLTAVLVFLLSSAFVVYVLAGYPLLLAFRARGGGKPVAKSPFQYSVSVLLAVRNGERFLAEKLRSIYALEYPRDLLQVIVISDGSTDSTDQIAAEFPVELIRVPPGGKAAALNAGMARATGDILFFTDVRQTLAPESLRNLVACFSDPSVGVASGELVILDGETQEETSVGLYWRYEKWMRRRLSQLDSVMGATGCIYCMRRSLAVPLPADTLLDDVHLPMAAFFKGYRVIWDDSAKAYDYPTHLDAEFHRKVRTQAGVYQVIGAYPQLLGMQNRMWIDFASHKLGRLLLPFALILIALSSFFLPAPWSSIALLGQAAFYGLALLDMVTPDGFPLKRLTSPIRTFVVLMAAALCAVSILFLPASSFWRARG